jgi:hypothetical protein
VQESAAAAGSASAAVAASTSLMVRLTVSASDHRPPPTRLAGFGSGWVSLFCFWRS